MPGATSVRPSALALAGATAGSQDAAAKAAVRVKNSLRVRRIVIFSAVSRVKAGNFLITRFGDMAGGSRDHGFESGS